MKHLINAFFGSVFTSIITILLTVGCLTLMVYSMQSKFPYLSCCFAGVLVIFYSSQHWTFKFRRCSEDYFTCANERDEHKKNRLIYFNQLQEKSKILSELRIKYKSVCSESAYNLEKLEVLQNILKPSLKEDKNNIDGVKVLDETIPLQSKTVSNDKNTAYFQGRSDALSGFASRI